MAELDNDELETLRRQIRAEFARQGGKAKSAAKAAAKEKEEKMRNARFFLYEGETMIGAFRTREEAECERRRVIAGALSECAYMHNEGVKAAVVANFTIREK